MNKEELTPEYLVRQLAAAVHPGTTDITRLSRAQQWKMWLADGSKTRLDLIRELASAPGQGVTEREVPWYDPGAINSLGNAVQWSAHQADERVKQFVAGWRAGKSKWLAAELLYYLFKDGARVWIVGNDYLLAREEFNYILIWLQWLGIKFYKAPVTSVNGRLSQPQEGRYQLWLPWGAHLSTQTAADIHKLEAANLDACGVAEAGQIHEDIIERLVGRVLQKGGPLLLAGSLEATEPWYVNRMQEHTNGGGEWHSFRCPSWANLTIFPGGKEDKKIKDAAALMPHDEFLRKVACEIVRAREVVFPEFDAGTHVVPMVLEDVDEDVLYRRMIQAYSPFAGDGASIYPEPVIEPGGFKEVGWKLPNPSTIHLAIDPGYQHYAVLAIVKYDQNVYVYDELYLSSSATPDIIAEAKTKDWWPLVRNGMHTIDVAGNQHNVQTGMTEIKMWQKEAGIYLRSQRVLIPEGIVHLRTFLNNPATHRPRLWISPNCVGLIEEFRNYRYRKQQFNRPDREEPIDQNNHSIKALTYWLYIHFPVMGGSHVRSERYITQKPGQSWDSWIDKHRQNPEVTIWTQGDEGWDTKDY